MTTNDYPLPERDERGNLPTWAWPGGYPIFYVTKDYLSICPKCANKPDMNPDQAPAHADINYEDYELFCEDCGRRIESAYGEDETESA